MDIVLSLISLSLRIIASYFLYKKYILPIKSHKPLSFYLYGVAMLSLLLGFYVYVSTLILLLVEGIRLWNAKQEGKAKRFDVILVVIIFILFCLGSKGLSIDNFLL